jgi:hypothetical protein
MQSRPTNVLLIVVTLGLAATLGAASPAQADPCAATLPVLADTWIALAAGPYASAPTLEVRTWPNYTVGRAALLQFDLGAVPAGATLQAATIKLTLVDTDAEAPPTYRISLHQIINVIPDLARATGNTYDGTHSWNTQLMGQGDIAAEASALEVDKVLGVKTWDATSIVAAWLSQPGTNVGVLLNADSTITGTRWRNFASGEHATAAWHPVLEVSWTCTPSDGGIDGGAGDAATTDDASGPPHDATGDAPPGPGDAASVALTPVIGWTCAVGGGADAGAPGAGLLLLGLALARRPRPVRRAAPRPRPVRRAAPRPRPRFLLLALALGLGTAPATTEGQREPARLPLLPAAQAHLDRGVRHYGERRLDEAVREFAAGYELDPRPEFLYALGQAHRARGDCDRATGYYHAFLRTAPPPAQAEKARVQLARCEQLRLRAAASAPASAPVAPSVDAVLPAVAPGPVVTASGPRARPAHARLLLEVGGLGDVVGRSGALEAGVRAGLGAWFDLGAVAVFGEHIGARVVFGWHPGRRRSLNPAVELRGVVHPAAGAVALGGGLWVGATWELGPGRLRAGAAGELFSAPAGYRSYAVLLGGGYQLDLFRR